VCIYYGSTIHTMRITTEAMSAAPVFSEIAEATLTALHVPLRQNLSRKAGRRENATGGTEDSPAMALS